MKTIEVKYCNDCPFSEYVFDELGESFYSCNVRRLTELQYNECPLDKEDILIKLK